MKVFAPLAVVLALLFSVEANAGVCVKKGDCGEDTVTIDRDKNGLYEWARVDRDWDGDGTRWHECDCGSDTEPDLSSPAQWVCGNYHDPTIADPSDVNYAQDYSAGDASGEWTECRFNSDRVWDDVVDDFLALQEKMDVGGTIFFPPGIYAVHGGTNDTDCWDSGARTASDTCQIFTKPDGTDETNSMANICLKRDAMDVEGAGIDSNAEEDLRRDGTWIVDERGNISTAEGYVEVGHPGIIDLDGHCGDPIFANGTDTRSSGIILDMDIRDVGGSQDTPEGYTACVCDDETDSYCSSIAGFGSSDFVNNRISAGDKLLLRIPLPSVSQYYDQIMVVQSIGSVCGGTVAAGECSTNDNCGREVLFGLYEPDGTTTDNHTPVTFEYLVANKTSSTTADVYGPLRSDWNITDARVTGINFAPQDYYNSSADCDATGDSDCDDGTTARVSASDQSGFEKNGFHYTSFDLDTASNITAFDAAYGPQRFLFTDNLVQLARQSNVMMDFASPGPIVTGNLWRWNQTNSANQIKTFGGGGTFARNVFYQNNTGATFNPSDAVLSITSNYTEVLDNKFEGNNGIALLIDQGARGVLVRGNRFLSTNHGPHLQTGRDLEGILIDSNIFSYGGRPDNSNRDQKVISRTDLSDGEFEGVVFSNNRVEVGETQGCFVRFANSGTSVSDDDHAAFEFRGNTLTQGMLFCFDNLTELTHAPLPQVGINQIGTTHIEGMFSWHADTVANLPTCDEETNPGMLAIVTDGSDGTDCSTGSGSTRNTCLCECTAANTCAWADAW